MNKKIAIIMEKQSVVVRGIEKKLTEEGYIVQKSPIDIHSVKKQLDNCGIFVIYLSADILDNKNEISNLEDSCREIRTNDRSAVLIGEKKYHDDLQARVPDIKYFRWLDRPVNMDALIEIIWDFQENSPIVETPSEAFAVPPLPISVDEKIDLGSGGDALADMAAGIEARLAMAQAASEPAGQPSVPPAENKKRILIVDDDPSYARMVKEWLRDTYKVDIVTNGMKAITFLLKQKVDLVLLDYEMPVVDGPRVLEMLRSEPEVADIPVIFLTGVGDMESVKRVMSLKPKGYVLKSTTKEGLLDYIHNIKE